MPPNWTDPTTPVYSVAADTARGALIEGRLYDDLRTLSIPNAMDLSDVSREGGVLTLSYRTAVAVADQATVDAKVKAHTGAAFLARHLEREFDSSGNLVRESIYSENVAGTLSGLVEETTTTYVGTDPDTETHTRYAPNGSAVRTTIWKHSKAIVGGRTIRKRLLQ